jgi:CRISPR-associated protein Cas4
MFEFIPISQLNDFIFCPYSIYLHNVYKQADNDLFHATPQMKGKSAHTNIDAKKYSTKKSEISGLSVYCDEFGIMGNIDVYKADEKHLIERKYKLERIFRGQIYQMWGQYFCMKEMGFEIEKMSFHSISTNKNFEVEIPNACGKKEFGDLVCKFKEYNPEAKIEVNVNKCKHCIYCNLCDKTEVENIYS